MEQCCLNKWIFWIIFLHQLNNNYGKVLKWLPSTNWTSGYNWNVNRKPCSHDEIMLFDCKNKNSFDLILNEDFILTELNLPYRGRIFLDKGVSLIAAQPNTIDSTCKGEHIYLRETIALSWFDEANWCEIKNIDSEECLTNPSFKLDTEMIPCYKDEILFPHDAHYEVDFSKNIHVSVSNIIFREPIFNSTLLAGNSEQSMVKLTGKTCSQNEGCECQNDNSLTSEEICKNKICEKILPCNSSFIPDGHCCHICGIALYISFDNCFNYEHFAYHVISISNISLKYLKDVQKNSNLSLPKISVSRISNKRVQVVVIDDGTGIGVHLGNLLKENLDGAIDSGDKKDCINNIVHKVSISLIDMQAQKGYLADSTKRILFWTFFFLFVIIVILASFAMRYRIKRFWSSHLHNRLTYLTNFRQKRSSLESDRRSVVYDNSSIFDNLSNDPTFLQSQVHLPEISMKDFISQKTKSGYQVMDDNNRGKSNYFPTDKIKLALDKASPKIIFSNIEKRLSNSKYPTLKFKLTKEMKEISDDYGYDNPNFGKPNIECSTSFNAYVKSDDKDLKNNEDLIVDDLKAFENPFFDLGS